MNDTYHSFNESETSKSETLLKFEISKSETMKSNVCKLLVVGTLGMASFSLLGVGIGIAYVAHGLTTGVGQIIMGIAVGALDIGVYKFWK